MNSEYGLSHSWDDELTDREHFFIGKIVAQWAGLEHEVFVQTLYTYVSDTGQAIELPKAMNNLQFTQVLDLWNERVVGAATGDRQEVLAKLFIEITQLKSYRDSIVHGMWDCATSDLATIIAVRIRKKQIISFRVTADELQDLSSRIGVANFRIRFPGGSEDLAQAMTDSGGGFSRRGLSLMFGEPITKDWLSLRRFLDENSPDVT